MYCYKCGEDNPDEARYCKNCGAPLKEEPKKVEVIEEPKSTYQTSQTTTSTSNNSDNSTMMGCCLCLIGIFIIGSILSLLGL